MSAGGLKVTSGGAPPPAPVTTDQSPSKQNILPDVITLNSATIAKGGVYKDLFSSAMGTWFQASTLLTISLGTNSGTVIANLGLFNEYTNDLIKVLCMIHSRFFGSIDVRLTFFGASTIIGAVDIGTTPQYLANPTVNDLRIIVSETVCLNNTQVFTFTLGPVVPRDGIQRNFWANDPASFTDPTSLNWKDQPHLVIIQNVPFTSAIAGDVSKVYCRVETKLNPDFHFVLDDFNRISKAFSLLKSNTTVNTPAVLDAPSALSINGRSLKEIFGRDKLVVSLDGLYDLKMPPYQEEVTLQSFTRVSVNEWQVIPYWTYLETDRNQCWPPQWIGNSENLLWPAQQKAGDEYDRNVGATIYYDPTTQGAKILLPKQSNPDNPANSGPVDLVGLGAVITTGSSLENWLNTTLLCECKNGREINATFVACHVSYSMFVFSTGKKDGTFEAKMDPKKVMAEYVTGSAFEATTDGVKVGTWDGLQKLFIRNLVAEKPDETTSFLLTGLSYNGTNAKFSVQTTWSDDGRIDWNTIIGTQYIDTTALSGILRATGKVREEWTEDKDCTTVEICPTGMQMTDKEGHIHYYIPYRVITFNNIFEGDTWNGGGKNSKPGFLSGFQITSNEYMGHKSFSNNFNPGNSQINKIPTAVIHKYKLLSDIKLTDFTGIYSSMGMYEPSFDLYTKVPDGSRRLVFLPEVPFSVGKALTEDGVPTTGSLVPKSWPSLQTDETLHFQLATPNNRQVLLDVVYDHNYNTFFMTPKTDTIPLYAVLNIHDAGSLIVANAWKSSIGCAAPPSFTVDFLSRVVDPVSKEGYYIDRQGSKGGFISTISLKMKERLFRQTI